MNQYYNANAQNFFDTTFNLDVSYLYKNFLSIIPSKANIIDAGCGSGRDSKHFLELGHNVIAFDASSELAKLASQITKTTVLCATFLQFQTLANSQDAIWACASMLHVTMNKLPATFKHLSEFLKPKGIFYCSFKYGTTEVIMKGRKFTNLNEYLLAKLLRGSNLSVRQTWVTADMRPERKHEKWLNALLIKL